MIPVFSSSFHIFHVLLIYIIFLGFIAILSQFSCIPFPGLLFPPQPTGSLGQLVALSRQRKWPLCKEQDGGRRPEKASTGCDVLGSEGLVVVVFFFKHVCNRRIWCCHLNQVITLTSLIS